MILHLLLVRLAYILIILFRLGLCNTVDALDDSADFGKHLPSRAVDGIAHWNSWFNAMLFLRDKTQYPLQLILRQILIQNDTADMTAGADYLIGETIQYATVVVATLPILCIYPFVQKYFVKGVMIGAIKG